MAWGPHCSSALVHFQVSGLCDCVQLQYVHSPLRPSKCCKFSLHGSFEQLFVKTSKSTWYGHSGERAPFIKQCTVEHHWHAICRPGHCFSVLSSHEPKNTLDKWERHVSLLPLDTWIIGVAHLTRARPELWLQVCVWGRGALIQVLFLGWGFTLASMNTDWTRFPDWGSRGFTPGPS